ncbi:hypothetical protein F2Q70_00003681 [Brassica cretica]|uniref:Uncharacterized protein n=1 Tax=Brassica cretica TaxID=69181 RepID=A0A3N6Q9K1_BRACR|nr:hypothetical protein F2Q70_00003681 [Brassica cretica]KAF3562089.1 hypothetical protein DY000_02015570 [Brassica cretica]
MTVYILFAPFTFPSSKELQCLGTMEIIATDKFTPWPHPCLRRSLTYGQSWVSCILSEDRSKPLSLFPNLHAVFLSCGPSGGSATAFPGADGKCPLWGSKNAMQFSPVS